MGRYPNLKERLLKGFEEIADLPPMHFDYDGKPFMC